MTLGRVSIIVSLVALFECNCLSQVTAQTVVRKEEPILAGAPGGSAAWESHEQPLDGGGNWDGYGSHSPNGTVFCIVQPLTSSNPNQLIVGGAFDSIGGAPMGRIALLPLYGGGNQWDSLGSGIRNGVVYCTISVDSLIFAGGRFTQAGTTTANNIAMWNGTSWHSLGDGLDSTVLAMAVMGDSLFVGGNFTHEGSLIVNHIAIWNLDSNRWEVIDDSGEVGTDGGVATILAPDNAPGDLYFGGGFLHAGKEAAAKIVKWSNGGWSPLGSGVNDTDGIVEAMSEGPYTNSMVVGGHFSHIGDSAATDVAEWIYGSGWMPIGTPDLFHSLMGTVYCVSAPNEICAVGDFTRGPTDTSKYIAKVGRYDLSPGLDAPAYSVLIPMIPTIPEAWAEKVFIGGNFMTAGGLSSPHFAVWSEYYGVSQNQANLSKEITISPNPVTSDFQIRVVLAERAHATVELFNTLGEKIAGIFSGPLDAGTHDFPLSNLGTHHAGDVLMAVLNVAGTVKTAKLVFE